MKQICSDSNHSFKNNCCTTSNNISPISNHQIQLPTTFPPTLDPAHHITSQNICILHQLKFTVGFLRNYDALHDTECTKRQRIFSYAQQDFGENIMDYASLIYFIYIYFTFIYSIGTQFKDHNDDQIFTLRNCKKYLTIA